MGYAFTPAPCSGTRTVGSGAWAFVRRVGLRAPARSASVPAVRSKDYRDVLTGNWRKRRTIPTVEAEPDLVVEEAGSGFCGAVVGCAKDAVTLEDRHGNRRVFPLAPAGFLLDGRPVTLARPATTSAAPAQPPRTASGSVAVTNVRAKVAKASRIYVEGVHDAALIERVWGEDLRIEGVVVEPLHGVDDLPALIGEFGPAAHRRLGVLVDHLVPGSKESRIVAAVTSPHVLVAGHPYVDIWQAVKPRAIGIRAWPTVPKGQDWKEGVCAALGVADPPEMWRRVLAGVSTFADLETPLLGAVERLIDHVTADVYGSGVR